MLQVLTVALALGQMPTNHHPAFFWGTQQIPEIGQKREILLEATAQDVEHSVKAVIGAAGPPSAKGSLLFSGRPNTPPEVQLIFLADGLETEAVRTHKDRLPVLNALLEKSPASLSVPFVLSGTHARAFDEARVRISGAQAEAFFKDNAKLLTDGNTDVIVVELEAGKSGKDEEILAAHDAAVGRITSAVQAGTKGNYAALVTGTYGARGAHRMLASKGVPPYYLHTGPTLLTAQIVMLILFIIFISGFCCLFSLQTPKKFEEVKAA